LTFALTLSDVEPGGPASSANLATSLRLPASRDGIASSFPAAPKCSAKAAPRPLAMSLYSPGVDPELLTNIQYRHIEVVEHKTPLSRRYEWAAWWHDAVLIYVAMHRWS
jgi:hypothetical protein